jgi:HK97 family phage major capsid protein
MDNNEMRAVEVPEQFESKDALVSVIRGIADRVNQLMARGEPKDSPEYANLETALADMQVKITAIEKDKKDANRTLPTEGNFAGMSSLLSRLQPEKGMDKTYYNLIALTPEEISFGTSALRSRGQRSTADGFAPRGALSESWVAKIRELQALNDLLVLSDILRFGRGDTEYAHSGDNRLQRMSKTRLWKDWQVLTEQFRTGDAAMYSGAAGDGANWVPTMMSSQLHELIQLELVLAPLFGKIIMPSATYDNPVMGGDTVAYKVIAEGSGDGETKFTASKFTTNKMTLSAIKLAARILASTEITEDSIINIAPILSRQMAKAIARGIDSALMNGDTGNLKAASGSYYDLDNDGAAHVERSWNGLRPTALHYSSGANVPKIASVGGIEIEDLLELKASMGIYGSKPNQGVWICGFRSLVALMQAKETLESGVTSQSYFLTPDKYPGNVLLNGEIGRVFGSPVILSEFVREDLNASGVYDGSTMTKSHLLYVNTEAFTLGERRALTVNSSNDLYMETDMVMVMSTWRGDFKPWYTQSYTTETDAAGATPDSRLCGLIYNV